MTNNLGTNFLCSNQRTREEDVRLVRVRTSPSARSSGSIMDGYKRVKI